MKHLITRWAPLLSATIFLQGALWAAPNFADAQKTWAQVRAQSAELNALISGNKLANVHDSALGLRDTVRELRFGWNDLDEKSRALADGNIRKIDGLLDSLHENADHNNPRGVAKDHRTLRVLLDGIAGAFPRGVLAPVGPLVATKAVKDPFCRMTVDPATAAAKVAFGGQTYYFCAASEAREFEKNPAPYVALYDEIAWGKPREFGVSVAPNAGIAPAKSANLVFAIREKGQTAVVRDFQLVHEKKFHLIAVSDDLSWFGHVHPAQSKDGKFTLRQTFPRAGRFWLYSDFTPASGANTVVQNEIRVGEGRTRAPQKLVPDATLSKEVDGVRFDLKLSAPLQTGKQGVLSYTLSKNGAPVRNMTPYLAAMGHMMAISRDGKGAVHTHTVSAGSDPQTGLVVSPQMATAQGPTQSFKLELPTGGLYKIWAQFGVGGKIVTVPFVFQVKENSNMKIKNNISKPLATLAAATALSGAALAQHSHSHNDSDGHSHAAPAKSAKPKNVKSKPAPKNAQRITVSLPQGYKTGAATVKAGKPVALTFKLASDAGCGNVISVPAAKWTKSLQVGQSATVVYTPKKSGPLNFQCSMGHMKGTLTVK